MANCKISVIWGLDKKYVLQAFVVMRSILMHSKEEYHFFILTADDIDEEANGFYNILHEEYNNFQLSIKLVDINHFTDAKIYNKHLSKAAYFRLFIPELVKEYDKCIYLDCDILVRDDLKELYEIELEDNYLAGVKDCHIIRNTSREIEHQRILGIPSRERYINSGVLVMNLKKMREDKLIIRFIEQMARENWYEDQDVLNLCCYPFIKNLPLKYNLFHFYLGKNIKYLYNLPYEKQDFEFDHDAPYILHMGADYKPWNSYAVKGSREWWSIAQIFQKSQSYQYYTHICEEEEKYNEILEMVDRAKSNAYVVVWGSTDIGWQVCDLLLNYQINQLTAIVDNDQKKWGAVYRGIPTMGFDLLKEKYNDIFWIVSCRNAYGEVIAQLKNNGIEDKKIFRYINRFENTYYLRSLHESAYDREMDRIADREYFNYSSQKDERKQYIKEIIENPITYAEDYLDLAKRYRFEYWIESVK